MYLKKSVILSLLMVFFLVGCSGDNEFGLGNGGKNNSGSEETPTDTGGGDTPISVSLALGTGSGSSFTSGAMTTSVGSALLSYGGDTIVTVNIVDTSDNDLYVAGSSTVSFTSGCVQNGKSQIDATVNSSTGTAVATYKALTCEGADTITATLSDGSSATVIVNVAGQILGALEFVSASPATIALKGSGSSTIPEVSTITFSLKDKTGAAMSGETISYALSTEVGGITLSSNSSVTNADGLTSVQLNAGGVNTSVVVTASVVITNSDSTTSTTSTTSNPIAILGGIPDQNSFSLSIDTLNPDSWQTDGATSKITIRAADRFNNQARTGTQVSFLTSGGAIVGSCALVDGTCSVNWTSQDPRTADGLVRILARTTGEESFIDANSNGIYDLGETVTTNLDEAFLDVNGDGNRDSDEFFSDFNNNNSFDTKSGILFQGVSCSDDALAAGHCAKLVDVRDTVTLCMSNGKVVTITDDAGAFLDLSTGPKTINFNISDFPNGLTPAAGTTVSLEVKGAEIISGGTVTIRNECTTTGHDFSVSLKSTTTEGDSVGSLNVKVANSDGSPAEYPVELKLF